MSNEIEREDAQSEAQQKENLERIAALSRRKNGKEDHPIPLVDVPHVETIKFAESALLSSLKDEGKKDAKKIAASTAASNTKIRKVLGDGERFRIYKIDNFGKESLIGDYGLKELSRTQHDLELFIQSYLVSSYGEGEYVVKAFNHAGADAGRATFSIMAPKAERPVVSQNNSAFEQSLIEKQQEQLLRLQDEQKELDKRSREAAEKQLLEMRQKLVAVESQASGGMGQFFSMFMQMQMQQQAQQAEQQRRADLQREQMQLQLQMQPQPLPPPPQENSMLDAIKLMATMKELFAPPQRGLDMESQYLRDRIRDLETMQVKPRTFQDVFKEFDVVEQYASKKFQKDESSVANVLGGFLENFAENMHALKEVISAGPPPQQQLLVAGHSQPVQAAPVPQGLPDDFIELVGSLDAAEDDEARIEVVMSAFKVLAEQGGAKYRIVVSRLLKLVTENKKDELLKQLKIFLDDCNKKSMVTKETVEKTFKAFDRHFDAVVGFVTGADEDDDEDDDKTEEKS